MLGEDGRILGGPQVVVASPAVIILPPWFDPAHLDGVDQFRHLLLLHQRRDEAPFVLRSVGDRVDHQVAAEELYLRLGAKASP